MCDSRLDFHACVIWIGHMVLYPIRYRRFSAGIVILCEDFRYSHIIWALPSLIRMIGFEPICWIVLLRSLYSSSAHLASYILEKSLFPGLLYH